MRAYDPPSVDGNNHLQSGCREALCELGRKRRLFEPMVWEGASTRAGSRVALAWLSVRHLGIPQRLRPPDEDHRRGRCDFRNKAAHASPFPFGCGDPQAPEQKERIVLR